MNYVIYNLDGTYHTTFSSIDYSGREEELLNKLKIDFDRVDYIVKVNEDVDYDDDCGSIFMYNF